MAKLAIIATHPIQYYSPWFRYLQNAGLIEIRVFYLWDFGITEKKDAGFGKSIQWDVPLLEGYDHEFVPNTSADPGTHHWGGIKNPEIANQVRKYVPDAVLLMTYNYAAIYRVLFGPGRLRYPILFRGDSHRIGVERSFKETLRRRYISFVFKRFHAVLSVGQANREYFRYHGVSADRIFSSPHAVDNDRFFSVSEESVSQAEEWKSSLGIGKDVTVIMYLGKFQRIKRVGDLVEAFRRADPKNAALLLVGQGEEEAKLRELATNDSRIYFAPFQNQSVIPRTLMAADLVVLPSESESWGLVLNEAMCMSRAIVASDRVGGARDLIASDDNGRVYPFGDVDALASVIREVTSNPTMLNRWGAASRRRVARFSYEKASEGLYEALRFLGIGKERAAK